MACVADMNGEDHLREEIADESRGRPRPMAVPRVSSRIGTAMWKTASLMPEVLRHVAHVVGARNARLYGFAPPDLICLLLAAAADRWRR